MTPEDHDRTVELLCDGALVGFTPDGRAELEALVGAPLDGRALDLEVAAAAVHLAELGAVRALPAHLADRAFASAQAALAARGATALLVGPASAPTPAPAHLALARGSLSELAASAPSSTLPSPPSRPMPASVPTGRDAAPVIPLRPAVRPARDVARWAGWLAAAACLAVAAGAWIGRPTVTAVALAPSGEPRAASAAADRDALLARAKDVVRSAWKATEDPSGRGVAGEVVWSPSEQRGFMRFRGLAANDRSAIVYQLWIFDAERDERYPVDGGVFDVDAATGDVVVPIAARLRVAKPTLFAVTIEKPGGVVVSKRERIVVTAAVPG